MRSNDRRGVAYAWLATCLVLLALSGIAWWRTRGASFEVSSGRPATIEAHDQTFDLALPWKRSTAAMCTVAPADGESRHVKVGPNENVYQSDAWWSGTATVTCDRRVEGNVNWPHYDLRLLVGLALLTGLGYTGYRGVVELLNPSW